MLIVFIITVSFTMGYIFFSKVNKSENNVFLGLTNTNKCYISQTLNHINKAAIFKGEHKRY